MMTQEQLTSRYEGVQSFLTEGCLFLSLISIAEQVRGSPIDLLSALQLAKEQKWIDVDNNLTITGQLELLGRWTGKVWHRAVYQRLPEHIPDEMYTIEKWIRNRYTHFKRRFVDTLTNSKTVSEGKLKEYYAYVHN